MARPKITVVGAGNVGATVAQYAVEKELGDVVLVDVIEASRRASRSTWLRPVRCTGSTRRWSAQTVRRDGRFRRGRHHRGMARKPGMTRDDLLFKNAEIVGSVVEQVARRSRNAILILVTNPLDAMVQLAWKKSGSRRSGSSAWPGSWTRRASAHSSRASSTSRSRTSPRSSGRPRRHDGAAAALLDGAGIPITDLLSKDRIDALVTRTANGGAEIVNFLKSGSAYYAPGASAVEMVEAILKDKKKILPCAAYLNGQYGCAALRGVPVKLGRSGVEQIVEITLRPDEQAAFKKSADAVRELVDKLKL